MADHSEDKPLGKDMQNIAMNDTNGLGIPELTQESDKPADNRDDLDIDMEELGDLQDLIADEDDKDTSSDVLANILEEDKPADIHDFIEDAVEQMEADDTNRTSADMPVENGTQPTETEAEVDGEIPQSEDNTPNATLESTDELTPELESPTEDTNVPSINMVTDKLEELQELSVDENDSAEEIDAVVEETPDDVHDDIEAAVEKIESYISASSDTHAETLDLEKTVELTDADIHNIVGDVVEQVETDEATPDNAPDESSTEKKITLTENDYADVNKSPEDIPDLEDVEQSTESDIEQGKEEPHTEVEASNMMLEPDENTMDEPIIIAAATDAAHTAQEEPTMPAEKKTKTTPVQKTSTIMPTLLGLLGIIIASGSLWMILDASKQMTRQESKLAGIQNQMTAFTPHKDVVALNQRMSAQIDKLTAQLTAHLKTFAQTKVVIPVPETKKLLPPPITTTKPTVAAVVPTPAPKHKPWVINLTSFKEAKEANNELIRLKKLSINVEIRKIKTHGKTWYRIRIPGFASVKTAEKQRQLLAKQLGIQDTWIGKY